MKLLCEMVAMGFVGIVVGMVIGVLGKRSEDKKIMFSDSELKVLRWMCQNTRGDLIKRGGGKSPTVKRIEAIENKARAQLVKRQGDRETAQSTG